jgi:ABC-type glutathione transport system ATPase component
LSAKLVERTYAQRRLGHADQLIRAVAGVSIDVWAGRSVGIIGESGSGKSTLLRLMLGLEKPDSGAVLFNGKDLARAAKEEKKAYRRSVQVVFQDSTSAFDPRQRLWDAVTEPVWAATRLPAAKRRKMAAELLTDLGLPQGSQNRYPHELSGGERQRASIARALSAQPKLVMLDEPVTALDVSIRSSVINLLNLLAHSRDLTYVVVSHDLTAVYYMTEYVYVMRKGEIVEEGPTVVVVQAPRHPYTKRLAAGVLHPLAGADDEEDEVNGPVGASSAAIQ